MNNVCFVGVHCGRPVVVELKDDEEVTYGITRVGHHVGDVSEESHRYYLWKGVVSCVSEKEGRIRVDICAAKDLNRRSDPDWISITPHDEKLWKEYGDLYCGRYDDEA
jgi:hypothetical protein